MVRDYGIKAKQWIPARFTVTNGDVPILTDEQMAEDVLWYVQKHDWVTYAELSARYGPQASGDIAHVLDAKNWVFWLGMSQQFADAIRRCHETGCIHPHATVPLTYLLDGEVPSLPVVKRNVVYSKPHWMPVTYRAGASCGHKDCPSILNNG